MNIQKNRIILAMIIISLVMLPSLVLACQQYYDDADNVTVSDIIVDSGLGASCNITTYAQNGTQITNTQMNVNSIFYNITIGVLPLGTYVSRIECNKSEGRFYSECNFEVIDEDKTDKMINYLTIAIIFIFTIFALIIFGEKFKLSLTDKKSGEVREIYGIKYLFWFVSGWLVVPLINIAIKIDELYSLGLTNTIGGLYNASVWIMVIVSFIFGLWILYISLKELGGKFLE